LFDSDGKPVYELWNEAQSVKLIQHYVSPTDLLDRGNAYHLFHDPKLLKFQSDEEEIAFWAREGISVQVSDEWEHSLGSCAKDFELGHVDLVHTSTNDRGESRFSSYKLHDVFGMYRKRVHDLTMTTLRDYFKERLAEGQ
jgi:hypothetical protein